MAPRMKLTTHTKTRRHKIDLKREGSKCVCVSRGIRLLVIRLMLGTTGAISGKRRVRISRSVRLYQDQNPEITAHGELGLLKSSINQSINQSTNQ